MTRQAPPPPPPPGHLLLLLAPLLLLALTLVLFHPPPASAAAAATTTTAGTGGSVVAESLLVGSCWRLKRRDGSCGRLLKEAVTRADCCSDRHRRAWSPASVTAAASSYTTTVAAAASALKPFNATPVVTLDVLTAEDTCTPCATTCDGVRCGEDRKCVVRCGAPRCVCSPQCHLKHKEPVCGSDGRTYRSECHLLKRACRKKKRLLVAHYGPCPTCSGMRCSGGRRCMLDEQLIPRCVRCPSSCVRSFPPRPLCAADARTYPSPCHLKRASCRAAHKIPKAYKGPCREDATCSSVRCWKGERCLTHEATGQPQCTSCEAIDSCKPPSRPVCASDGREYPSWCAFRHEACRSGRAMTLTVHHHCAQNHTEVDDCNKRQYKPKRNKQRRRHQELLRAQENALRQEIQTQRVLHQIDLEASINSVEAGGAAGHHHDHTPPRSHNNTNKNRKRRKRRRNCKKNRTRARKDRERNKLEKSTIVEGD